MRSGCRAGVLSSQTQPAASGGGKNGLNMEVNMNTKGRKLFRCAAGVAAVTALMSAAYATTAMASGIGQIDTADLLDIHAEADSSSEVVGQVMDEGHVAILEQNDGWVRIQAGEIIGWVPDANLIETDISNEEAVWANEEVIEELAEEAQDTQDSDEAAPSEEAQEPAEEETASEEAQEPGEEETAPEEASEEEEETAVETVAEFSKEEQLSAQAVIEEQKKIQQAAEEAARQARIAQQEQEAREALAMQQALEAEAAKEAQKQAILASAGVTEEELYLLANIIYCEAGCEPYIGKVAVGSVVLNRVASDRQPDNITDVIYAKGQFSPVRNGSLQRALDRSSADESCYQAALEALAGAKPVGDKLYFRRVNGRSGQVIGHHVFY